MPAIYRFIVQLGFLLGLILSGCGFLPDDTNKVLRTNSRSIAESIDSGRILMCYQVMAPSVKELGYFNEAWLEKWQPIYGPDTAAFKEQLLIRFNDAKLDSLRLNQIEIEGANYVGKGIIRGAIIFSKLKNYDRNNLKIHFTINNKRFAIQLKPIDCR